MNYVNNMIKHFFLNFEFSKNVTNFQKEYKIYIFKIVYNFIFLVLIHKTIDL